MFIKFNIRSCLVKKTFKLLFDLNIIKTCFVLILAYFLTNFVKIYAQQSTNYSKWMGKNFSEK